MNRAEPAKIEAPPSRPHCVCMSGLSAEQVEMIKFASALEFAASTALSAEGFVAGPAPIGNPEVYEWLLKARLTLTKLQHEANARAFPRGAP